MVILLILFELLKSSFHVYAIFSFYQILSLCMVLILIFYFVVHINNFGFYRKILYLILSTCTEVFVLSRNYSNKLVSENLYLYLDQEALTMNLRTALRYRRV